MSKGGIFIRKTCLLLAFAIMLMMPLPSWSSALWTIEAVDAPKSFNQLSQRAIAVGKTTNFPHIAYGGDNLYHAYFDGTQWQYETVDNSSSVGENASITLDSSGKVHISYFDYTNGDLKYATNASGAWVTIVVDSAGNVGRYNSIPGVS